jgi:hypothetical protein
MLAPQAEKTLSNDSRFWIVEQFLTNEEDYEQSKKELTTYFGVLTEYFHSLTV